MMTPAAAHVLITSSDLGIVPSYWSMLAAGFSAGYVGPLPHLADPIQHAPSGPHHTPQARDDADRRHRGADRCLRSLGGGRAQLQLFDRRTSWVPPEDLTAWLALQNMGGRATAHGHPGVGAREVRL